MEIFSNATKDGICIISDSSRQSQHAIDGYVLIDQEKKDLKAELQVVSRHNKEGVLSLANRLADLSGQKSSDWFGKKPEKESGIYLFGQDQKGFKGVHIDGDSLQELPAMHHNGKNPGLDELVARLCRKGSPNIKDIPQSLAFLYALYTEKTAQKLPALEIGLIGRKNAVCLYSPNVRLERGTQNDPLAYGHVSYILDKAMAFDRKSGGFLSGLYYSQDRRQLQKSLCMAVESVMAKKSWFFGAQRSEKKLDLAKEKALDVSDERLGEKIIHAYDKGKAAISQARLQREMDKEFLGDSSSYVVLEVARPYRDIAGSMQLKHDLGGMLGKEIGNSTFHALENGPFVIVEADRQGCDAILNSVNNRKAGNFSYSTGRLISEVRKAGRNIGVYTPELIADYVRENNISLLGSISGMFLKKDGRGDFGRGGSSYVSSGNGGRKGSSDGNGDINGSRSWFRRGRQLSREQMEMWNLEMNGAYAAQDITMGNGAVLVIIDTGSDYRHPEIDHNIGDEKGYNFVEDSDDPLDDNGHGTHVDGIIRGKTTGVAPQCTPYFAKILNGRGAGSMANSVRAIDYAIKKQADVVNMSYGCMSPFFAEKAMCDIAAASGIIMCAAAGNDSRGKNFPAAYDSVVSIAAIDFRKKHAPFSNIDSTVEFSQPGVDIYSSYVGGGYRQLSGTSMASPHNAGIFLMLRSVNPSIPLAQARQLARSHVEILGSGESEQKEKYGSGMILADKLVAAAQSRLQMPGLRKYLGMSG